MIGSVMREPSSQYEAAVRNLYKVFKRYRFTDLEGDPVFPRSCDPAPLLSEPLHLLPHDAFRVFGWKAVTTWGTEDDLRHFLPRMLELADQGEHLDTWQLFSKVSYAKWRAWPEVEQAAIQGYVDARWQDFFFRSRQST